MNHTIASEAPKTTAPNAVPYFSIVIPTLNEAKRLPLLLTDLAKQTFQNFEVLVVDGDSDDPTVQAAKKYTTKLHSALTILSTQTRNVSHQRNLGAQKAVGEWVLFMDADNLLPEYFLEGVKYQIAKHADFQIFTTWVSPDQESPAAQAIVRAINVGLELYDKLKKPAALGAMIGVKRELLKKIQFDETQKIFEDSFFVRDVVDAGFTFRLLHEPTYVFSLRRMRRDGTLKTLRTIALTQLFFLQGKDFSTDDFGYSMEGGLAHEAVRPSVLHGVQTFIQTASQKQLAQAKKIVQSIKDFEL